ncbi:MAG: hypothetical protein PHY93_08790 [Bacteriovorax sp.]|nr:hypothetical protein [Bacteriovorax sp.]
MNAINTFSESLSQYRSRIQKSRAVLSYASTTSLEEFVFNIQRIKSSHTKKDFLKSLLSMTNSGIWVSRSAFIVLKSFFDIRQLENSNFQNEKAQEILAGVVNKSTVVASDALIFKTIYTEITHSHLHKEYKSSLTVPPINVTIVLVSGVLNEIFSTPAFKRGAENLLDEYNIKHIAPTVDGKKGSRENSILLKKQINQFIEDNPSEKLWFFCFSKGGIDTLHYLKSQGEDLSSNILGFSFIATPILGSDHVNNKILKLVNTLGKVPEEVSKIILGKKIDFFAKELQKSLSHSYRTSWFKKYYKDLPQKPFYTAIAFESKWHQSHVWMMLTKAFFRSHKSNDGVVDVENAQFPAYFNGINLGILEGHHLVGSRSSFYDQEALMKAHLIFLNYKKLIK